MGARIIQLADVRARRSGEPCPVSGPPSPDVHALNERFHFWTGASGGCYVHTVYSLLECPELSVGNFVLVRRDSNGRRQALNFGVMEDNCGSLNLATVRQLGAKLGANEVHVHLLAQSTNEIKLIDFDLRSGQFDSEIVHATKH